MDESAGTVKSTYEPAEPRVPFSSNKLNSVEPSGDVPKRKGCDPRLLSEVSNLYVFPFSIRSAGASSPLIKYFPPEAVTVKV